MKTLLFLLISVIAQAQFYGKSDTKPTTCDNFAEITHCQTNGSQYRWEANLSVMNEFGEPVKQSLKDHLISTNTCYIKLLNGTIKVVCPPELKINGVRYKCTGSLKLFSPKLAR